MIQFLDLKQTEDYLNLLGYNPNEMIYFRAIKPNSAQKIEAKTNQIPWEKLRSLQSDGYNLYLVVNGQGHTDAKVKIGRAIFYEHDNLSKDIQRDLWQKLGLPEPTFQVDTGGKSIHSYWVFDCLIAIEQWKQLQAELLEFADADRSIKNPSRVMRLAGSIHQGTQKPAAIVSSCGIRYSYENLRAAVPASLALASSVSSVRKSKDKVKPSVSMTLAIPLENCLTKEHRDFISNGISEGGRNSAGAALARDLIGTAARLDYLRIEYAGSAIALFEEFTNRCNPPLPAREAEAIWKSAQKNNPTACLSDDAIENCLKAWQHNNRIPVSINQSPTANRQFSSATESPNTENNGGNSDSGGGNNGSGDIPSDRPDPDEVFKLEVINYSDEVNPFKKLRLKGQICANYRVSAKELQELVDFISGRSQAPKSKRHTGKEFLQLETEGIKWLIPGIIPGRGVTILGGDPGVGKTTIAYDMAASILYRESFLGEDITQAGKVLFISSDEQPCFAQDKLINRGFTFDDRWQFVTDWDISQKQEFEEYLEDFHPQFVMMDSFAAIHRDENFDENSSQAKATVYWLESMANKYGCAILLIHHCTKNREQKGVGKLRGSSAIAGACSAVLLLEGQDNIKSFSAAKIRGAEPFKWDIALDPETGRWSTKGKTEDLNIKSLSDEILVMFQTKYPTARLETLEIQAEVGGEKNALYKALDRLCKRGLLIKRPSEKNRRFKVYGLPLIQSENTVPATEEHSPPPMPLTDNDPTSESIDISKSQTLHTTLHMIVDNQQTLSIDKVNENYESFTPSSLQILHTALDVGGGRGLHRLPQIGDRVTHPHHLGINYPPGEIYKIDNFMGENLYRVNIPDEAILSLTLDELIPMGVELVDSDRTHFEPKIPAQSKPEINLSNLADHLAEDAEAIISMIKTACLNDNESVVLDELQMIKDIIASSKQNLSESEVNDFRRAVWMELSTREQELFKKLPN